MGLAALEIIVKGLLDGGKAPESLIAVLAEGTLEDIATRIKKANVAPSAVIVVRNVAAMDLRSTNAWHDK